MGKNLSRFKAPDNPAERVSWDDCRKFPEKLNSMLEVKESGPAFRLPTEAERECACRAGLRSESPPAATPRARAMARARQFGADGRFW